MMIPYEYNVTSNSMATAIADSMADNTSYSTANQTGNDTATGDDFDLAINIIGVCLWTITTLLILLLNTACLVILSHVKTFSQVTKIFLRSMTICDLVLCIFLYLPMIGVYEQGGQWPYSEGFCIVQAKIIRMGLPVSSLSVFFVTIDRYVAIAHPLRYNELLSPRRARIIVCSTWILTFMYAFLSSLISKWKTSYTQDFLLCFIGEHFNESQAVFALTFLSLGIFATITVMYLRILLIARRHAAHIARHRPSIASQTTESPPPSPSRKSFTTVFIITVTLVVGWMPSVIVSLVYIDSPPRPVILVNQLALAAVSWLNVFIYYIRNRAFKEATHLLVAKASRYCKDCCRQQ